MTNGCGFCKGIPIVCWEGKSEVRWTYSRVLKGVPPGLTGNYYMEIREAPGAGWGLLPACVCSK